MCEPTSILMVASLVFSAYSANEQGKTAKDVAAYNAREDENNAIRTRNKGVEEEIKHRNKVAQLQSKQRAQLGASNVDIRSGSALDIQEDAQLLGEVDSLRVRSNFSDQADALDRSAYLSEFQGEAAEQAGQNAALGTLLSGAGTVAGAGGVSDKWYNPNSSSITTTTTGAQANSRFGNVG